MRAILQPVYRMFVRMNLNRKRCGDVYMRKGLITLRTVLPYYERVPATALLAKVGTGAEWMGSKSVPLMGCSMGMGQEDAFAGDNIGDAMGKLYVPVYKHDTVINNSYCVCTLHICMIYS